MQTEEGKKIVLQILGQNIDFDGHFEKCFENLKETQQQDLMVWIRNCKEYQENIIQSKRDRNIIGFVKRFGSNLRAILTQRKESYFLSLFLDKHKYYEVEMEKLGF